MTAADTAIIIALIIQDFVTEPRGDFMEFISVPLLH